MPGVDEPERTPGGRLGRGALSAAFLLLAACATTGSPEPGESRKGVLKVAHRGAAGLAPENTLAAFRVGIAERADALELDVHLSRDGELVVIHDAILARTTNALGEVGDLDLAQLRGLDASARFFGPPVGPQTIPTLQEVLDLARGSASVQVEIKLDAAGRRYPGIEERVVRTLRESSFIEGATILSFDFPTLQAVKRLEPRLLTCALISRGYMARIGARGPGAVGEEMAALGVDLVGVEQTWLSQPLYEELRRRGLGVGVWTVDNPEAMRRFAAMGVDFLTSNRPDILRQTLDTPAVP